MKTKLFTISSLIFAMLFFQIQAQDKCTPVGWATQNGGVTGGGSASATVVSTYAALKTAVTTASVKVVHIQGTITFPSSGRINIQDQSGKTIIGLPGSKLISVDKTASGSGIFYVKRCSNFIFRNISFEGPGAYDVDGNDNMTIDNSTNIWVDHCDFYDGMDGNLDIKNAADLISVTWCVFGYKKAPIAGGSGGADDHRFSNLFGSSDGATGDRGKLRITMQYCWWTQGCKDRMPRVRFGKVHMVNNLFTSTVASNCIRAGFEADILAEGNYFQNQKNPIDLFDNTFTAVKGINNYGASNVTKGTAFTPPYSISIASANSVVTPIQSCAGAKLSSPTGCSSCGGSTPPVNTPPTVNITAPSNNASFTAPAVISITANAADANGTVSNVQFYNGSILLGSDATSPYTFSWGNVAAGTYSITARATDNAGAVTTSSVVSVTVTNPTTNTPPTVSITAPSNNASFPAPASISITAAAADANGTVSNVQFYNGSTLIGSDATSPYTVSWSNVAAGTYSITARATDNAGAVTTSSVVNVTVSNSTTNTPPTVNITAPSSNASFTAPAAISISANAADANGTISNVQFYNGSTHIGSDATSPYTINWSNVAAGTYSITARATDNAGAVTTSAAVTITVTAVPPVTTSGIVSVDCGSSNQTIALQLSEDVMANAISSSWWYTGSAASITAVTGALNKATLSTGPGFGAGEVCAGVNYNVAPWWKQYCKKISVCGAREGLLLESQENNSSIVYPNPTEETFNLSAYEGFKTAYVTNMMGEKVLELDASVLSFGKELPAGTYMLNLNYSSGKKEVIKIVKLK